jgi:hypothetical protein
VGFHRFFQTPAITTGDISQATRKSSQGETLSVFLVGGDWATAAKLGRDTFAILMSVAPIMPAIHG